MKKLRKIFRTKTNVQLIIVFIVFTISGSLSVFFSEPLLDFFKIDDLISYYPLYLLVRIIIIFPLYQIILIIIGTLFGQNRYFMDFQKRFFMRFKIKK